MKHPYLYILLLLLVVNQTANAVMACCLIDSQTSVVAQSTDDQGEESAMPCHGESDDVFEHKIVTDDSESQQMCDDCQDCIQLTLHHDHHTSTKLFWINT